LVEASPGTAAGSGNKLFTDCTEKADFQGFFLRTSLENLWDL